MNRERWDKIKELFGSAVELDPSERTAFLRNACGPDESLRAEVESLLAAYKRTEAPGENPPFLVDPEPFPETLTGRRLGSYQVLHEIGHGGMAVVYAAVRADDEYRKRVAIKVVLPGLDSADISRRFRNERQTLATLDHPNIVRLLDGGSTEQGLPYLVMEYVDGVPIDQYCDSHRLSTSERLLLFRTVCTAVQYAHQNLVIHRDLKPSNILVTADGTPKLLDFGIAKLLNPESAAQPLLTLPQLRPMTLDYASPEQFHGQPVTTSTDVYSLGVLLYELLTGSLPYDLEGRSPLEMERIISELEPERPSMVVQRMEAVASRDRRRTNALAPRPAGGEGAVQKLGRRLRGDLDNIVLMALRKEPQRRYASVEQLSEDVRRHLEGVPVIARTATLRYRSSKFIGRHRTGVAAVTTLAAALVLGIVVTTHEAQVARAERGRAERRFEDVRHLANSLFELDAAVKDLPGATPARKLIVQKALEYLDNLAREATGDPALQADLAEAYLKVGEVQHAGYRASLGDATGALESYRRAGAIAAALGRAHPNSLAGKRYLARSEQSIAGVLLVTGHAAQAADSLRRAIPGFDTITAAQPGDTEAAFHLADSYNALGDGLGNESITNNLGDTQGALENYRKSLAIYQHLAAAYPSNRHFQSGVAVGYAKIGDVETFRGDSTGALEGYRKALTVYQNLSAAEPNNAQYRGNLAAIIGRAGHVRDIAGNKVGALKDFRWSLEEHRALAVADPKNVKAQNGLWNAYFDLAKWLERTDRRGAMENYRLAIAVIEPLSLDQPTNLQLRAQLGASLLALGDLLSKGGDRQEGQRLVARGAAMRRSLVDRPDASPGELNDYATTLLSCDAGHACSATSALSYAKRAVELTKEGDPQSLATLALAYFRTGDAARAVETEQKAVALVTSPAARAPYAANLARFEKTLQHRPGRTANRALPTP